MSERQFIEGAIGAFIKGEQSYLRWIALEECMVDGCHNRAEDDGDLCLNHWWQYYDLTDGGCGYGDE